MNLVVVALVIARRGGKENERRREGEESIDFSGGEDANCNSTSSLSEKCTFTTLSTVASIDAIDLYAVCCVNFDPEITRALE